MRTLETERLLIRPFVPDDATEFKRLLDGAFGTGGYGSHDATRLLLDYNVIADRAHDALHQPPYEDRAIVLREGGTLVGSVGLAPCLAPFGRLPSFGGTAHRTPEVGLFWALFRAHWGHGYSTSSAMSCAWNCSRSSTSWRSARSRSPCFHSSMRESSVSRCSLSEATIASMPSASRRR